MERQKPIGRQYILCFASAVQQHLGSLLNIPPMLQEWLDEHQKLH